MDDKTSLLNQLRIDREEITDTGSSRRLILWIVSAVLVLGLFAAGWWVLARPSGIPVRAAIAQQVSTETTGTAGASMLDASGYVVARRQATVSAKIIGRVVDVLIEEGQQVEEDQIIARLDDSTTRAALAQAQAHLAQAEASLEASRIALEDARPTFIRSQQQREAGVISEQAFDTAKAQFNAAQSDFAIKQRAVAVAKANLLRAQRDQEDTIVRAPFAGVITVKAAQPGEIVSPSSAGGGFTRTGIGTVVDMNSLEVEVDVSENFITRVRPGQPAIVRLNAYPDWEIPAEVIAVIPTADRSKATVKVRVGFKSRDERVLPDMGARVSFLSDASANPGSGSARLPPNVIVPREAVLGTGDTGTVFVINGDTLERRVVRLGARTSAGQVIQSGLTSGTRVVVGDLSELEDGMKVYVQN